jgi:hypothetical protein
MYYYYEKQSGAFFCQEEKLPIGYTINNHLVEELTLKKFLKVGHDNDLFFKVSQSKVKLFRKCHFAYRLKYILKLRKRVKGHALVMGSLVHEAIEQYLNGKPISKPFKQAKKEFDKMFVEEQSEMADVIPTSRAMVEGYIEHYKDDGLTPIEVELEIEVPLVKNILLTGKVDSLQEDKLNKLWQVEHKTCKSIPEEKQRMSDIQTVIYDWALPQLGFPKPIGVIWDYLRKKVPAVPELLKNGKGLSRNAKMDTTYDVYYKAILDNDLNPEDYEDHLELLKGREDNFFRRIKMPISQSVMDSIVSDFKSTAIQMQAIGHIATDRNMTRDCSWCDYYSICQSDLRGGDTERLIKTNYIKEGEDHGSKKENRKEKARKKVR